MRALKIIALISVILLCISGSVGIAAAVYVNTSWLRNEMYLACTIEPNDTYTGSFNWTLLVSKNSETVKWEGFGNDAKPRTTEYMTASAIRMSWASDEGATVTMHLNRLDGRFRMERVGDKDAPKLFGFCYERQPQF